MTHPREKLIERCHVLGIIPRIVPYPMHRTVEEGKALRGSMEGTFTKNLLLKDKKGRLYLVVADEDRAIDLKTLHTKVGASGRVGFAAGDLMERVLGVGPGALTPFAVMNDDSKTVTLVIDAELLEAEQLNFHPLVQTESMGIHPRDLLAFLRSYDREPIVIDLRAV